MQFYCDLMEASLESETVPRIIEAYNNLLFRSDCCKIELDSPQGDIPFRNYMSAVQQLSKALEVEVVDRVFREKYTNAYRILYSETTLGYIPEIYDAAQEGLTFISVNGEKFCFSSEVLIYGETLVEAFYKLIHQLRFFHAQTTQRPSRKASTIEVRDLRDKLAILDLSWTNYEQKYIEELIAIEKQSKKNILAVVKIETALQTYEIEQKIQGRIFLSGTCYDDLRRQLCSTIAQLNSIANIQGRGRDDLSYDILLAAENILTTVTSAQSNSLRIVAQKIRESFENVREVLRFFGTNLEMVDPQLKGNPQLVVALQEYEYFWEKGKRYFLESQKESQIVALSTIVDAAREKYPLFQELIECSDPSIFWIIPSLVILRSLEGEDEGLTESFFKSLQFPERYNQYLSLKSDYTNWKCAMSQDNSLHERYITYNAVQKLLIESPLDEATQQKQTLRMKKRIQELAVSLERIHPLDWNDMLGVLLISPE